MTRISVVLALGLVSLGLAACGGAAPPPASRTASTMSPRDRLKGIAERYWDEQTASGDPLSPQHLADVLASERRCLADLLDVPRAGLDADSALSYDMLKRRLDLDIEGFTYPAELLPMSPFDGMPLELARSAAEVGAHPHPAAREYEDWLKQIDAFVIWTDEAIANMREGLRRGYTSPRPLVERVLPLLQGLGDDAPANVFFRPLQTIPSGLDPAERTRITQSVTGAVKDKLLPAMRRLHDFLQREYLPRTRQSIGLSALPLGPSWYAFRVRRATSTALSPNDIHAIGLAEVERIRGRLAALPPPAAEPPSTPAAAGTSTAAPGTFNAAPGTLNAAPGAPAAGAAEPLNGYVALKEQVVAALPALFSTLPSGDFVIREALAVGTPGGPLSYQPAVPDQGKPAILYISAPAGGARPRGVDIAGFLSAALPGRHLQSALQQERVELPKFRRFDGEPAFEMGWALYAATLGEELGVVRDDDTRRRVLAGDLNCAAALVVDTGLHANSWTRSQAIDYLQAQTGADAATAAAMADRFAAQPGDALACKIGELKIRALRTRAQTVQGARFDVHEFHSQLLKEGAVPLDFLETRMKSWMEKRP